MHITTKHAWPYDEWPFWGNPEEGGAILSCVCTQSIVLDFSSTSVLWWLTYLDPRLAFSNLAMTNLRDSHIPYLLLGDNYPQVASSSPAIGTSSMRFTWTTCLSTPSSNRRLTLEPLYEIQVFENSSLIGTPCPRREHVTPLLVRSYTYC